MSSPPLGLIAVALLLIIALVVIMAGGGGRLSETRLIMLGIVVTLAAYLFEASVTEQVTGRPIVPDLLLAGKATAALSKIGFVLVLAGVIGYLWKSVAPAPAPTLSPVAPNRENSDVA